MHKLPQYLYISSTFKLDLAEHINLAAILC